MKKKDFSELEMVIIGTTGSWNLDLGSVTVSESHYLYLI